MLLKTLLLLKASDAWRLLADAYHELDRVEAAAVAAAEAAVVVDDSANVDVETLRRKWELVVLR